jgi:tripartite-type tricarboxylate transporter receptor subunit TctC
MRFRTIGLAFALGLLTGPLATELAAQDFPSRPIRFLQGFAPGGNADVIVRVLGDEMARSLGQPVVAEARPGAGGNLASEQTARAAADGYTIVLLTTAHVISPALYKSLNFDPVKDFDFVSTVSDFPFFFVVGAESPYKTVQDLVAAARAKPGTITIGTAGVGTGQHMFRACALSRRRRGGDCAARQQRGCRRRAWNGDPGQYRGRQVPRPGDLRP